MSNIYIYIIKKRIPRSKISKGLITNKLHGNVNKKAGIPSTIGFSVASKNSLKSPSYNAVNDVTNSIIQAQ